MSDLTNRTELFHTFSKSPTYPTASFKLAVNKGGHTITTSQMWAEDVPLVIKGTFKTFDEAKEKIGVDNLKKNDIVTCLVDGEWVTQRWNGTRFYSFPLTDGTVLKNSDDKDVVVYHEDKELTILTDDNNSNATSNDQAARLWVDGSVIESFISVSDKTTNGYPATGYTPVVKKDGVVLVEGETYWANTFAGMINFEQQVNGATITISCFEYIGGKLSTGIIVNNEKTTVQGKDVSIYYSYASSIEASVGEEMSVQYFTISGNYNKGGIFESLSLMVSPKSTESGNPDLSDTFYVSIEDSLGNHITSTNKCSISQAEQIMTFEFNTETVLTLGDELTVRFHNSSTYPSAESGFCCARLTAGNKPTYDTSETKICLVVNDGGHTVSKDLVPYFSFNARKADMADHMKSSFIHITNAEREKWNKKIEFVSWPYDVTQGNELQDIRCAWFQIGVSYILPDKGEYLDDIQTIKKIKLIKGATGTETVSDKDLKLCIWKYASEQDKTFVAKSKNYVNVSNLNEGDEFVYEFEPFEFDTGKYSLRGNFIPDGNGFWTDQVFAYIKFQKDSVPSTSGTKYSTRKDGNYGEGYLAAATIYYSAGEVCDTEPISHSMKPITSDAVSKLSDTVSGIVGSYLSYKVVTALPPTSSAEKDVIYLVGNGSGGTSGENNNYTEYIGVGSVDESGKWVCTGYEKLGDIKFDASQYYTKTEINTSITTNELTVGSKSSTTTPAKYFYFNGSETDTSAARIANPSGVNILSSSGNIGLVTNSGELDLSTTTGNIVIKTHEAGGDVQVTSTYGGTYLNGYKGVCLKSGSTSSTDTAELTLSEGGCVVLKSSDDTLVSITSKTGVMIAADGGISNTSSQFYNTTIYDTLTFYQLTAKNYQHQNDQYFTVNWSYKETKDGDTVTGVAKGVSTNLQRNFLYFNNASGFTYNIQQPLSTDAVKDTSSKNILFNGSSSFTVVVNDGSTTFDNTSINNNIQFSSRYFSSITNGGTYKMIVGEFPQTDTSNQYEVFEASGQAGTDTGKGKYGQEEQLYVDGAAVAVGSYDVPLRLRGSSIEIDRAYAESKQFNFEETCITKNPTTEVTSLIVPVSKITPSVDLLYVKNIGSVMAVADSSETAQTDDFYLAVYHADVATAAEFTLDTEKTLLARSKNAENVYDGSHAVKAIAWSFDGFQVPTSGVIALFFEKKNVTEKEVDGKTVTEVTYTTKKVNLYYAEKENGLQLIAGDDNTKINGNYYVHFEITQKDYYSFTGDFYRHYIDQTRHLDETESSFLDTLRELIKYGSDYSLSFGFGASAAGAGLSLGHYSESANGTLSIGVQAGYEADDQGDNVNLGSYAVSNGYSNITIGNEAESGKNTTVNYSIVIGSEAYSTKNYTTTIGSGAENTYDNTVLIRATNAVSAKDATDRNITYTYSDLILSNTGSLILRKNGDETTDIDLTDKSSSDVHIISENICYASSTQGNGNETSVTLIPGAFSFSAYVQKIRIKCREDDKTGSTAIYLMVEQADSKTGFTGTGVISSNTSNFVTKEEYSWDFSGLYLDKSKWTRFTAVDSSGTSVTNGIFMREYKLTESSPLYGSFSTDKTTSESPWIPCIIGDFYASLVAIGDGLKQENYIISADNGLVTFDDVPTENSSNPVKSGGIYSHTSDTTLHITSDERTSWTNAATTITNSGLSVDGTTITLGNEDTTQVTIEAGSFIFRTTIDDKKTDVVIPYKYDMEIYNTDITTAVPTTQAVYKALTGTTTGFILDEVSTESLTAENISQLGFSDVDWATKKSNIISAVNLGGVVSKAIELSSGSGSDIAAYLRKYGYTSYISSSSESTGVYGSTHANGCLFDTKLSSSASVIKRITATVFTTSSSREVKMIVLGLKAASSKTSSDYTLSNFELLGISANTVTINTEEVASSFEFQDISFPTTSKEVIIGFISPENIDKVSTDGTLNNLSYEGAPTEKGAQKILVQVRTHMVQSDGQYWQVPDTLDPLNLSGNDYTINAKVFYQLAHYSDTQKHITSAERTTWNNKQNALSYDTAPVSGSTKILRSGGIYTALSTKVGTSTTEANQILTMVKMTQTEYDALETKDENTFYVITE